MSIPALVTPGRTGGRIPARRGAWKCWALAALIVPAAVTRAPAQVMVVNFGGDYVASNQTFGPAVQTSQAGGGRHGASTLVAT